MNLIGLIIPTTFVFAFFLPQECFEQTLGMAVMGICLIATFVGFWVYGRAVTKTICGSTLFPKPTPVFVFPFLVSAVMCFDISLVLAGRGVANEALSKLPWLALLLTYCASPFIAIAQWRQLRHRWGKS